jgi:Flp pilus assembly protein TadB
MREKWWSRPLRERWYETDPANFLLAALLLLALVAVALIMALSWNPFLAVIAAVVVPVWMLARRRL